MDWRNAMKMEMPVLSGGDDEIVIISWYVAQGSEVSGGQDLLEVATDKATFDVPSPCDGVLEEVIKKGGDPVRPGEVIAHIREK